jgi:tetratricopeptide (TPR) repeat protein
VEFCPSFTALHLGALSCTLAVNHTMKASRVNEPSAAPSLQRQIFWSCLVVIGLHIYGALAPNSTNWGFHFLGFYPLGIQLIGTALFCALMTLKGQNLVFSLFQRLSRFNSRGFFSFILILAVLGATAQVLWSARERTFFLGDGYLILRTLPNIIQLKEVASAFRNEPFAGWVVWRLYHALVQFGIAQPELLAYQVCSILFGVGTVVMVVRFASLVCKITLDKVLVGAFILSSGFIQLFFGYVELYAPSVFALFLYFTLALLYLQERVSIIPVGAAFGLLTSIHLGMQCLAPSFAFLLIHEMRRGRFVVSLFSGLLSIAVFSASLLVTGYTWTTFWSNVSAGGKPHFLSLSMSGNIWQPYSLFSLEHFLDLVNLVLLVSPLLVASIILLGPRIYSRESWNYPEWVFLFIASVSSLLFLFAVNSDLGVSRDWDLLGTLTIPSILAVSFLLAKELSTTPSLRRLIALMAGITLLHTVLWIALNANAELALSRFVHLQDNRLWSKGALCNAYEELSIYYRDRGDFPRGVEFINSYLAIDSTNSRVWVSKASILLTMKEYGKALEAGRKGVQLDSNSARAQNNLGAVIVNSKSDWVGGLPYFLRAIALDSTLAEASLNAGLCFQKLGDKGKMRLFWERFLRQAPNSSRAADVRQELANVR